MRTIKDNKIILMFDINPLVNENVMKTKEELINLKLGRKQNLIQKISQESF